MKSLRIGDVSLDKLEVVLADFQEVSQELPVQLHGILGVQFFEAVQSSHQLPAPQNLPLATHGYSQRVQVGICTM
ncbi:MAG: hypothetical protein IPM82_24730 [Saprospiraceae bacterium]|nr:hypothetical protein [Saprospiraceae bacterium]